MPLLSSEPASDRHAAQRLRHRRAILEAASELYVDDTTRLFTVDELARRADVSRRTIFNHFRSVDDVLVALTSEALAYVMGIDCDPAPSPTGGRPIDELIGVLRSADLVGAFVYLHGGSGEDRPRRRVPPDEVLVRAAREIGETIVQGLHSRDADADVLELRLLVGSAMNGLAVLHREWVARAGVADTPASRAEWDRLLDRLVAHLRAPSGAARQE